MASSNMQLGSKSGMHSKLPPLDHEPFWGFQEKDDIKDLRFLLTTPGAATFNTNILRIALNMNEEKIASIIVAYYSVKIDEDMILRAVRTGQINFL